MLLPFHRSYEVGEDDRSFIMARRSRTPGDEANRLTVVLNRFQELETRSTKAP